MNRPIRNRKKVVAARATEQGIAGHQAALAALGSAAGGWERAEGRDLQSGARLEMASRLASKKTYGTPGFTAPLGEGHVKVTNVGPESTTMRMGSNGQAYDSDDRK